MGRVGVQSNTNRAEQRLCCPECGCIDDQSQSSENIDSTSENSPSKSSTGSYLKCIHHGQMGRMRVSGLWQDDGTEVPIGTPQMVALLIKTTYSRYNQVSQRSSCNPITSHCYHSVSGSSLLFCGLAELLLRPRIAVAASTGTRSSI
jgi:hypothetical protein